MGLIHTHLCIFLKMSPPLKNKSKNVRVYIYIFSFCHQNSCVHRTSKLYNYLNKYENHFIDRKAIEDYEIRVGKPKTGMGVNGR